MILLPLAAWLYAMSQNSRPHATWYICPYLPVRVTIVVPMAKAGGEYSKKQRSWKIQVIFHAVWFARDFMRLNQRPSEISQIRLSSIKNEKTPMKKSCHISQYIVILASRCHYSLSIREEDQCRDFARTSCNVLDWHKVFIRLMRSLRWSLMKCCKYPCYDKIIY